MAKLTFFNNKKDNFLSKFCRYALSAVLAKKNDAPPPGPDELND